MKGTLQRALSRPLSSVLCCLVCWSELSGEERLHQHPPVAPSSPPSSDVQDSGGRAQELCTCPSALQVTVGRAGGCPAPQAAQAQSGLSAPRWAGRDTAISELHVHPL